MLVQSGALGGGGSTGKLCTEVTRGVLVRLLGESWCPSGALLVVVALLFVPRLGLAQTGGPGTLEFSFSNPGARSLAMAGAFAGLADDATAVYANPAGLTQLIRPEVSIEGRRWHYTTPFIQGGRLSGQATGVGLDTPGLREQIASTALNELSFASFVYPSERWAVAVHRHALAKFEAVSETQGFFFEPTQVPPTVVGLSFEGTFRAADIRNAVRLDIVAYGVSFAYRLGERVSVGGVVNLFQGDISNTSDFFLPVPATLPEGFVGPSALSPAARVIRTELTADDSDWGASGGLLWHVSPQWHVGAFYRQAPTFALRGEAQFNVGLLPAPGDPLAQTTGSVSFPDVFGAGVAYRSEGGALTLSAEWCHVQYSTILDELDLLPILDPTVVTVDDGNELRAGFEYVFLGTTPVIAVRGGMWRDPDHRFRGISDAFTNALFVGGSDTVHGSFGIGLAVRELPAGRRRRSIGARRHRVSISRL